MKTKPRHTIEADHIGCTRIVGKGGLWVSECHLFISMKHLVVS